MLPYSSNQSTHKGVVYYSAIIIINVGTVIVILYKRFEYMLSKSINNNKAIPNWML